MIEAVVFDLDGVLVDSWTAPSTRCTGSPPLAGLTTDAVAELATT